MAPQLYLDMAEAERRKLIQDIRSRGRQAYETEKAAITPTVDYADAARAAFAADPVELPPGAADALMAGLDENTERATAYIEALGEIFRAGQQRELEYGNEFYDMMPTVIGAQQHVLDERERELAEAEAARLSSRGGRRSSGGGDDGLEEPESEVSSLAPWSTESLGIEAARTIINDYPGYDLEEALGKVAQLADAGVGWPEVAAAMRSEMSAAGIPTGVIIDYLRLVEVDYTGASAAPRDGGPGAGSPPPPTDTTSTTATTPTTSPATQYYVGGGRTVM